MQPSGVHVLIANLSLNTLVRRTEHSKLICRQICQPLVGIVLRMAFSILKYDNFNDFN